MRGDDQYAQRVALLRRLQGLEAYAALLKEVLNQQARLCLALAQGRPEPSPPIRDVLLRMGWKAESAAALTPDIVESAMGQLREEEIVAGLRDVRAGGGQKWVVERDEMHWIS